MQIFPANNIWNTPVDSLPVHPQSDAWLGVVGTAAKLRLDDVLPVNYVAGTTPFFNLPPTDESDGGGYPIPPLANIEVGSDLHCLIVQGSILYEIFNLRGGPAWVCDSAAKWDLGSNALRPDGWTSADAAGLPIFPGLLRYDEVLAGAVTHALRFTAPHTQGSGVYLWPARHYASHFSDGPPMGARCRLKASFDVSKFTQRMQVVLNGLKKYGAMLADNGQPWGMQKVDDPRWDAAEIVTLHNVLGASMEFVDASGLMTDSDSGAAGTPTPGVFVTDLMGRKNSVRLGAGLAVVNGALTVTGTPAAPPPVAIASIFVKADSTTQGNWKSVYGSEGSLVIGDGPKLPAYAAVTPLGNAAYTWLPLTADKRGLQVAAGRTASCWYSATSFMVDINLSDGKAHQVAAYFADWDGWGGGRSQLVEVLNASGAVLDSRTLFAFAGGQYLIWNLSGHVTLRLTNLNSQSNALITGLFFDPAH